MRVKNTIVGVLIAISSFTSLASSDVTLFDNEKVIEFKANSGATTDAVAGHFWVSENRNNSNTRKIRVSYVRFPAIGKSKGAPIVYLAGGPGGSGIGTAQWRRFPLFQALREYGDVIALDQRGTGQSEQTDECTSSVKIPLDKRISRESFQSKYRSAAKECFSFWKEQGVDIYGYTTVQNAWDIEDLRIHLKAEKVSLWGISYGSHLALAAMKLFPDNIEKVIIASAEGLNQTVKLPSQTDQYFKQVQSIIDLQSLKSLVSNLPALMHSVHEQLDKNPLEIEIPSKDGGGTKMLFQTHHLQSLASKMIADPNQYLSMLIHLYYGLSNNSTDLLVNILQRGVFTNKPLSFRLMPLAMDVASGITDSRLNKVTAQAKTSLLADFLNFPMPLLNNLDSKLDLGDKFREKPVSGIPTLLLTGTLDGRTYPSEQIEAVSGLSNLTQIRVQYAGHNLFTSSPEVLARMEDFLAGKEVEGSTIELPLPDLQLKK